MSAPDEGDKAPAFTLPTDGEGHFTLPDTEGRRVVLFCYPKDDTSGCTAEAIAFTALSAEFAAAGAIVVGMSPDTPKKHDKFKAKHDLGVTLIADEDKSVLGALGVWVEKSMYGRKYMGVERSTFIIGPDGTIQKAWRKVKVPGHAEAVLDALKAL